MRQSIERKITVAARNGDFGPWNILVGPNGVVVIDFVGCQDDALPMDLLKMLVYLETLDYGLPNSRRRIAALRKNFLAGFGDLPRVPAELALLCEAVLRISNVSGTVAAGRLPVLQRWERTRNLRRDVQWLLGETCRPPLWPN